MEGGNSTGRSDGLPRHRLEKRKIQKGAEKAVPEKKLLVIDGEGESKLPDQVVEAVGVNFDNEGSAEIVLKNCKTNVLAENTESPKNSPGKSKADATEDKVGEKGVIRLGEPIARGVYSGRFDDEDVVVKRVDIIDSKQQDFRELEYLRKLDHKNVVKYKFSDRDQWFSYIVLEKCNCTLAQFVRDFGKTEVLDPYDILWQITEGMVYLHEDKDFAHRDLKPTNILMLLRDKRWIVKITDFGISKALPSPGESVSQSQVKGTMCYMAPEQIRGGRIGKHTDIFSMGLIFHFVLSDGKHPFGENDWEAEDNIRDENGIPNLDSIKAEHKHDAEPLVRSMISRQKEDRLPVRGVQAHHLFWDADKKMVFIQRASEFLEDSELHEQLLLKLESSWEGGNEGNWRDRLFESTPQVKREIEQGKEMKEKNSLRDLLRLIRNWSLHFNDPGTDPKLRDELGDYPEGFANFFTSRFPSLLPVVYKALMGKKDNKLFEKFYGVTQFHLEHETRPKEISRSGDPDPVEDSREENLEQRNDDDELERQLLIEKASTHYRNSKYALAAKVLSEVVTVETSDFQPILLLADCYLRLNMRHQAEEMIGSVKRAITSSGLNGDNIESFAAGFIDDSLYVRAIILLRIASDLFEASTSSPDELVENIHSCIYNTHLATQPMVEADGQSRKIGVEYGVQFMTEMYDRLKAVENANHVTKAVDEAWSCHYVGVDLLFAAEYEESFKFLQAAVRRAEDQLGPNAPQYCIYGLLLHNLGVNQFNLNKFSEAESYYIKAIEAHEKATDWDDESEKQNSMKLSKDDLKETREKLECSELSFA